jgi:hypothetical protein
MISKVHFTFIKFTNKLMKNIIINISIYLKYYINDLGNLRT